MVRNGLLTWIKPFCDFRCCQKNILLQHYLNKIKAQNRKHKITGFKFVVPFFACSNETVPLIPNTSNEFLYMFLYLFLFDKICIKCSGVHKIHQSQIYTIISLRLMWMNLINRLLIFDHHEWIIKNSWE